MKGLLAPQNTFLDTIATRFDGTRESGLGRGASAAGTQRRGLAGITVHTMGASSSLPSARQGFPWYQKPAMRRERRGSSQPLLLSFLASPQLCR